MSRNHRRSNTHHLFFPKRDYTTPLERQFRELECNKVQLDIQVHNLLHVHQKPPGKPTRGDMLHAIQRHQEGLCACSNVIELASERRKRRG